MIEQKSKRSFLEHVFIKTFSKYLKLISKGSFKRGYFSGRKAGYLKGHDAGILKYLIKDERSNAVMQPVDKSIYGPEKIPVNDTVKSLMVEMTKKAYEQGLIGYPTESQWDMIFSEHPATCVVAGAGSGKSTTLVLRVVFMHFYLKIPLSQLTVISFTTKSCEELREKIYSVFQFWGHKGNKETIGSVVSTFHSLIYRLSISAMPGLTAFDFFGDEIKDDDILDVATSKKTNEQLDYLKKVYTNLYLKNNDFKTCIDKLIVLSLTTPATVDDKEVENWKINLSHERDLKLVNLLNERWRNKGIWPIEGIVPEPQECFHVNGRAFYSNGYVEHNKMPVFLSGSIGYELLYDNKEIFIVDPSEPKKNIKLGMAISVKNRIIAGYNNKLSIMINSNKKLDTVVNFLSLHVDGEAPSNFSVKLSGELNASNILDLLYDQGSFIESLGKDVVSSISKISLFREESVDFFFAKALSIFWKEFEKNLHNDNMMTFNRMFMMFSDESVLKQRRVNLLGKYRRFENLLIDEFQDISPQIANWIKAMQRENAILCKKPTIMAIGDDWQSIYSWRGSSPDIFMNFSTFFPVHRDLGKHYTVKMMENFRSDEKIIHDAESLMKLVVRKIDKKSLPCRSPDGDEAGVKCDEYDSRDENDKWQERAVDRIQNQFSLVSQQQKHDKTKVIVLSRTNNTLKNIEKAYAKKYGSTRGIKFLTIHSAKGLQGEVCFIFDDSKALTGHVLRNEIYKQVECFHQSYDQAMVDESYRLAYVAITRGVKRAFWIAPKGSDGAFARFRK
ncbi:UvrD-helicase domain-containing protein [Pectobacterium odoriferum]|uniref:UvrD-helicase domain-containing protein n=1 Tax=Pectobacterium odoriferum TaxID=78398 RepID=UPI0015DED960|nr:UvrD-helicase domain-containing protein [Pectobacterium odoriferum]MBA0190658.1 UvrD-helicase domain-containing protein [Pectobacterium odoriferum]